MDIKNKNKKNSHSSLQEIQLMSNVLIKYHVPDNKTDQIHVQYIEEKIQHLCS